MHRYIALRFQQIAGRNGTGEIHDAPTGEAVARCRRETGVVPGVVDGSLHGVAVTIPMVGAGSSGSKGRFSFATSVEKVAVPVVAGTDTSE